MQTAAQAAKIDAAPKAARNKVIITCAVTGAAGFVALNIVEHLLTSGREVVGLDRVVDGPQLRGDEVRGADDGAR